MQQERRQEILTESMIVMQAIQRRAAEHRMMRNWKESQQFDELARGIADMALNITKER